MPDNFNQEMVMKPGKVFCGMFLLAILEVDPAQNLAQYKKNNEGK